MMPNESDKNEDNEKSRFFNFLLSFIQALLKTGYYTPGHPEASKSKEGLYNDLISILKGHREISFIAVTLKEKRDVLIDGVFEEPVNFSAFMSKGMGEMFITKFLTYFDRKNLSCFSIKADITPVEFENFIDIMSESPFHKEKDLHEKEKLSLELIKKGVLHVSTIFNIDIVGKERKLPWRIEIVLARLKKDLSIIPLYKNLSTEKISELKNMVFEDIIRPAKNPLLIKDLLVNLDLISSDITGINKEEFEESVTDYIHKDYLIRSAPEILKSLIHVKESYEKLQDENISQRLEFLKNLAQKVALKTIEYGCSDETLLTDFFKHGLVSTDELPKNISIKMKRGEEFERFIENPQKYFSALEKMRGSEGAKKIALLLINFLPEILNRRLYTEARDLLIKVRKTGFDFNNVDIVIKNEIVARTQTLLEEIPKEERMEILNIIDLMDEMATIVLINLIPHNSRFVRRIACEKLINRGKTVIPELKETLEKRIDWYFIRNALMILGTIGQGYEDLGKIFIKYLNHQEARVRVEAVVGIVNSIGVNAEDYLIRTLQDDDPNVRRKSVWALGKITSTKSRVISYFIDTILGKSEENDPLIEQVLSSMGEYSFKPVEAKQFEQAIVGILSKTGGFFEKIVSKNIFSEYIKAKMCETLGTIGTDASIEVLNKISRKDKKEIREKANEAIEKIQNRSKEGFKLRN